MIKKISKEIAEAFKKVKYNTGILEDPFAQYLTFKNIKYIRQFNPIKDKRFKCDFYLPKYNIIIEIEGGIFIYGRHNRGKGYSEDCKKYNLIMLEGYKVIRFTTDHFMRLSKNHYTISGYIANVVDDIINKFEERIK